MSFLKSALYYNYYAKPDGHAPVEKIIGFGKYAVLTGSFVALYDSILISKTTNVVDTLRCFGFWVVPLTGMAAAFASTTYIATNLREKDGPLNYVLGAIAAGGVLQAWQKCGLTTLYGTIFLSIFAAIKKDSQQKEWSFFRDMPFDCKATLPLISLSRTSEKKYERGWTKD